MNFLEGTSKIERERERAIKEGKGKILDTPEQENEEHTTKWMEYQSSQWKKDLKAQHIIIHKHA